MKTGIIVKSTGSRFWVDNNKSIIECRIRGKFRLKGIRTTNPLAVGDIVDYEMLEDNTGLIHTLQQRRNYIIRKATNLSKESHIIASNIDQSILVATMIMPETQLEFIDRFLVTSEIYKIPAIIIFNKIDLYTPELIEYTREIEEMYRSIGYECIELSAITGENIEILKQLLKDKTSLLSGNSGVGKSTIINSLDKKINRKTNEISQYHLTGKHTTTFAEMFELDFGGKIIDTPGIKGFGIIDMNQADISHNFPEMFELLSECQFYNCTHTHEPKCAVKKAVEQEKIAFSRYKSYLSLLDTNNEKYRADDYE